VQSTGAKIDYVHDEKAVREIASRPGCVGLILDELNPNGLVAQLEGGVILPRKTFSLGHARDKRYYLEARKIK